MKYLLLFFSFTACATTKVCQSVEQEPISICRAEVDCEPSGLQKFGLAISGNQSANAAAQMNYRRTNCINANIEAQKANAALKMMSNIKD